MKFGFIYLWKDTKNNKFYLGSHQGRLDDGYIGSGSPHFKNTYAKRPETFRRRILETLNFEVHKELRVREEYWLAMVKTEELGNKYYNLKRYAGGGDIFSELSKEKQAQHREKSRLAWLKGLEKLAIWRKENPERIIEIAKYARSCVKNPSYGPPLPGELNPFYGKKHTKESLEKMSLALKGRESNRKGCHLEESSKILVALNNPNRKPVRTPYGDFESASQFANKTNLCTDRGLVAVLKSNTVPITKYRALVNPLFKEEDIGKTPKELGYYYITDKEVNCGTI
jgi:group I intron endonuclease